MRFDNNGTFTAEELHEVIVKECHDGAKRWAKKYDLSDSSDLESYLIEKIWIAMSREGEENYRFRFLRHVIKLRAIDFVRSESRFDPEVNFCELKTTCLADDGITTFELNDPDTCNLFLNSFVDNTPDMDTNAAVEEFRATLDDKSNRFLDLKLLGFSKEEICKIMNVSINTPRNIEKRIAKLAAEFGL